MRVSDLLKGKHQESWNAAQTFSDTCSFPDWLGMLGMLVCVPFQNNQTEKADLLVSETQRSGLRIVVAQESISRDNFRDRGYVAVFFTANNVYAAALGRGSCRDTVHDGRSAREVT